MNILAQRPFYGSTPSDDFVRALSRGSSDFESSPSTPPPENAVNRAPFVIDNRSMSSRRGSRDSQVLDLRPFQHKLRVYGREFLNQDYGAGNAAMLGGMAGLGVANGGYMVLLKVLGMKGSSLPVVASMYLTTFSMILSGASRTYTSHQRDNQDIVMQGQYEDYTSPAQYCRYLTRCNAATIATNVILMCGAMGYAAGAVGPNALLGISVVTKSVEACLKGIELGYWNCIKTHLGDAQSQADQRDINRTIVGIETISQALATNATTMATFFLIGAPEGEVEALSRAISSLALGCAIIGASSIYFFTLSRSINKELLSPA